MTGQPGSQLAGALKTCCPQPIFTPQYGNGSGTNCIVTCRNIDASAADNANPCMKDYYDSHAKGNNTGDNFSKDLGTWTCNGPDPNSGAVLGRTGGWGGLVILSLVVSAAVTMF